MKLCIPRIACAALLPLALAFCGGEEDSGSAARKAVVTYLDGEALHRGEAGETQLKPGSALPTSGTIQTGAESVLDFSVEGIGAIRLLAESEFELASLEAQNPAIRIDDGNILVKVTNQIQGGQFSVVTPTATAGVRGTQFWGQVRPEEEAGVFAVREGKVEITLRKSGQSIVVEAGQAVEIAPGAESMEERKALDAELQAMEQIDDIALEAPQ